MGSGMKKCLDPGRDEKMVGSGIKHTESATLLQVNRLKICTGVSEPDITRMSSFFIIIDAAM
jgi:hypothetical protein